MTNEELISKIKAEIERRQKSLRAGFCSDAFTKKQKNEMLVASEELDRFNRFLSDLEKSEKPTNIDFEQELYNHFGQVKDFTLGMMIGQYFYNLGRQSKSNPERKLRKVSTWVSDTERELKEKSENPTTQKQPVCEGLEKEMEKFIETFGWGKTKHLAEKELISTTARHFAQWGAEHRGLSEILKDLEEAAEEYSKERAEGHILYDWVHAFIAGAKWQKEQMKEAVEVHVSTNGMGNKYLFPNYNDDFKDINDGDKVRIIIVKED